MRSWKKSDTAKNRDQNEDFSERNQTESESERIPFSNR